MASRIDTHVGLWPPFFQATGELVMDAPNNSGQRATLIASKQGEQFHMLPGGIIYLRVGIGFQSLLFSSIVGMQVQLIIKSDDWFYVDVITNGRI